MSDLFTLDGKVALVTGSSRGLGFAMAEALAAHGALVVLNGRDETTLAERAGELKGRGLRAEVQAFDVTSSAAITAAQAAHRGRRVAILDIDYHHGNGTQDIFYGSADILFASIHADPRMDYPFYWGHAEERGEGAGEGKTVNLRPYQGSR